jgi:YrbI family 3-deoxy-D-manno-octulosonate 8-phosphate phosphatase
VNGIIKKIKYILSDIDGVLTDGRFLIDEKGNESKQLCYRDLDAIGIGRKAGIDFIFITGESSKMVDVIARRFAVNEVVSGAKDKLSAVRRICSEKSIDPREICYIGDADRDAPAIKYAGIGIAPPDGTKKAKEAADFITDSAGGAGVLLEVVDNIIDGVYFSKLRTRAAQF